MADIAKNVAKLAIGPDGRSATNWNSYKLQLENALSDKQTAGLYLDDVLLNKGDALLTDPGDDEAEWVSANTGKDKKDYLAALKKWNNLLRAIRVTHSYIMATVPESLHEECSQRPLAHELWNHLNNRFAGQTLVSAAALYIHITHIKMDDYPGVSAFLTAVTKLEMEIHRATGNPVEPALLAGTILNGMGSRYPTTKELLLQLPLAQQTKEEFGLRLLNAEKNASVAADVDGGIGRITAGVADPGKGCGYVRKMHGRGRTSIPGQKCVWPHHKRESCFLLKDDEFLSQNPDKTPEDLPDWRVELRNRRESRGKMGFRARANVAETAPGEADVTAAAVTLSNTFLDYTGAVGPSQTPTLDTTAAVARVEVNVAERIIVALDSGATATCLKEKVAYKRLPQPVPVHGAGQGVLTMARGTSTISCPALPGKGLTGVYSPAFRHNLISLKTLQRQGVEVVFPAKEDTAECRNPDTGQVLWKFKCGPTGLYEASITANTAQACATHAFGHPTELLHHQLGHMSGDYLRQLINNKAINGLPSRYTPAPPTSHCLPCVEAKTQAKPHPLLRTRASAPLQKVHVDLVGPYPIEGLKGEHYRLTIVDDYSRFGWCYTLHTKEEAKHKLIEWIALVENQSELRLKHLHGDRGGEFLNRHLLGHLNCKGVRYTFSNPHSPQQNGVAEARNKASGRILLALLRHSEAPMCLWPYAAHHATLINNLYPHGLLHGKTPYEAWHGRVPNMARLKVWGCTGHVLLNKDERRRLGGKLGPVTKPCVLVGLNPLGAGWLLLDTSNNREVYSSDVDFWEDVPFYKRRTDRGDDPPLQWVDFPEAPTQQDEQGPPVDPPPQQPFEAAPNAPVDLPHALPDDGGVDHNPAAPADAPALGGDEDTPPRPVEHQRALVEPEEPRRSLRQQGQRPNNLPASNIKWYPDEQAGVAEVIPRTVHALVQTIALGETGDKRLEIPTPNTLKEALNGEHGAEWMESMVKEYNGLKETGTFKIVPRKEARNVVKPKWVYKVKRRPDGSPLFKSRLVAKGFSQREGIDYFDTWAPTARHTTARAFLHLAASNDMLIEAMDVDQAFLQGELLEEIYMEPPPGMSDTPGPEFVWRLERPLYGLKQSPRRWHAKLKAVLLQLGFRPTHSDPSLYVAATGEGTWILVYVDDMLLAASNQAELRALKEALKRSFPMKELGEVQTYLGMEVTRNRAKRELYLSQKRYITDLLHRFGQTECKEHPTPLAVNHNLGLPTESEVAAPGHERYAELLGGIMYLMVCTRPDIAHAVSVLSRFIGTDRHGPQHWTAALRLLGYLKGTARHKLVLGGFNTCLEGHSDSSWADDLVQRRSSQGYCFNLGSGVISWKAGRSPAVALSTCEAELYAGTAAAQDAVWLMQLLRDLGHAQDAPTLWCDNESTVAMTKDPLFSARSKHIEARYFFIRELVQAGRIKTRHIRGIDNVADIFTKPLSQEDHQRLVAALGLRGVHFDIPDSP